MQSGTLFTRIRMFPSAFLLTAILVACPEGSSGQINAISATASATTLEAKGTVTLSASVQGSGSFNAGVDWSLEAGSVGNLSASSGSSTTYTAPLVSSDTTVTVVATAQGDKSKAARVSLSVKAPTISGLSLSAAKTDLVSSEAVQLSAQLQGSGPFASEVQWQIESGGGSLSSPTGVSVTYTAPSVGVATAIVIRATASRDSSKTATLHLTVNNGAVISGINLSAPQTTLEGGSSLALSAALTGAGSYDPTISWSLVSGHGQLSSQQGATVSFTAAEVSASEVAQIKAASSADPSKFVLTSLTITPKPPISLAIAPDTASLKSGQSLRLSAAVAHAADQGVTWTSSAGTITPTDSSGNSADFTAPSVTSDTTVTVTASAKADPTKTASATINVRAPVLELVAMPLHSAYNAAGFDFGAGVNPAAISVPYGVHFHLAARVDGVEVNGTWATSNASAVSLLATDAANGSSHLARFVGAQVNGSATVSFSAPGFAPRQVQVNVGVLYPKRLQTTCVGGSGGYAAVRPDGRYVISGDLTGMGLPGVTSRISETVLGPATTRPLRGCVAGGTTVVLVTDDPTHSYASGEFTPQGTPLSTVTEFSHCPLSSIVLTHDTGHLVCQDGTGYAWGSNNNGQFGADLPLSSARNALRSNGGSGFAVISTEKYSLGLQRNGLAWATGDWYGSFYDGGPGDSRNWVRVPTLDGMVACENDNDLTVCIPPARNYLVVHGVGTGGTSGERTGKLHYRPEVLAIPPGEIAVAVDVGQQAILLLTETGIYRRGALSISPTQPSCSCWEKLNVPGEPLEVTAMKGEYMVKTTAGAFRNLGSGFIPMEVINPNASFVVDPPSINLLERVVGIVKVHLEGFSSTDFWFNSQDPSVQLELGNWVDGWRELRLHCIQRGVSTNVILTHKIYPEITKSIPVQCSANQPPTIVRFYELNNNLNPKPWDSLKLKWQINDPEGQAMTCLLDLDDNGTWDHVQNNCNDGNDYSHVWNNTQVGARQIKLRVEDIYGAAREVYLGFEVQASNLPPTISSFTATPSSGTAPVTVNFAWSVSDPNGDALTCSVDANGDGAPEYSLSNCSSGSYAYSYSSNGNYNPVLTVSDGRGGLSNRNTNILLGGGGNQCPQQTIASGYVLVREAKGIQLFQSDNNFVQRIELCSGASLRMFVGAPGTNFSFARLGLSDFWNTMGANRFAVVNGQFFGGNPTQLAFGVKQDGTVITQGSDLCKLLPPQSSVCGTYSTTGLYYGHAMLFEYSSIQAKIRSISVSTSGFPLDQSLEPNAIISIDENARRDESTRWTMLGVSDDGKIVYILSSGNVQTPPSAGNVLRAFGASQVMLLDGGGSTQLIAQGDLLVSSSDNPDRPIPHVIGSFSAP